jgi:hypothetical protein
MSYYLWRSDLPATAARFGTVAAARRAMRAAMRAIPDRRIEWCVVRDPGGDRDWRTVVCGRHGDRV